MPEAKASAHTQYYHDYIQDAIKRGQKEKQVLDSLGDPRLIAKTLIDTDAEPSVFPDPVPLITRTGYLPYRKHRLWKSVGQ